MAIVVILVTVTVATPGIHTIMMSFKVMRDVNGMIMRDTQGKVIIAQVKENCTDLYKKVVLNSFHCQKLSLYRFSLN